MRIKRTFAPTMRDALQLVKLEQGPDAVILGNKKVPGGIELISAIDYDEAAVQNVVADVPMPQPLQSKLNTAPKDSAADTWVGSVINDSMNERKEPTLGQAAVKPKKKPVKARPKSPTLLERELLQAEVKAKRSARRENVPVRGNTRNSDRQKLSAVKKSMLNSISKPETVSAGSSIDTLESAVSAAPMMEEVKHELKNLRDLMESQLSVLQWDKFSKSNPVRTVLLNLMSEMGLGSDVCELVLSHLDPLSDDPHKVWQQALGKLASCLPISRGNLLAEGGRIALVGSTGVGKTTTIAKLAARFAHAHGKRSVAMISTDHFRVGAQEQLQHYARLLEVPLLTASNSEELSDRLDMLADKKLVLVDTAGMSQRDIRLSEQFDQLTKSIPKIQSYLVLSANTQLAALNQTIQNFSKVKLAGAFVTKLDEAASLGGVITASIRHQLPLTYCGIGQRVPEDLEVAKTHRIISKAVALMQDYSEQTDQEALAFRYKHIINKS